MDVSSTISGLTRIMDQQILGLEPWKETLQSAIYYLELSYAPTNANSGGQRLVEDQLPLPF